MKGRFRILKTGIPLHGIEATDKIWMTCCALHNFLLEEDELDEAWAASVYLGESGYHDQADVINYLNVSTLAQLDVAQRLDTSGMGVGTDVVEGHTTTSNLTEAIPEEETDVTTGVAVKVHKMDLATFKSKLIHHFNIMWKRGQLEWPSRNGTNPPPAQIVEHYRSLN